MAQVISAGAMEIPGGAHKDIDGVKPGQNK